MTVGAAPLPVIHDYSRDDAHRGKGGRSRGMGNNDEHTGPWGMGDYSRDLHGPTGEGGRYGSTGGGEGERRLVAGWLKSSNPNHMDEVSAAQLMVSMHRDNDRSNRINGYRYIFKTFYKTRL